MAAQLVFPHRLERQIPLQQKGFEQFRDAQGNEKGFVGIHNSWWRQYTRKKNKETMNAELQTGQTLAELGHEVLYNMRLLNRKGGPVDMIWNGVPVELYTPKTGANLGRRSGVKLSGHQSDAYIIHLTEKPAAGHLDNLYFRCRDYVKRHKIGIYILHDYGKPKLEEVNI